MQSILDGTICPNPVCRVEIPKENGKMRGLGIHRYAAGFEVTIDLATADVNGDGVTNSLDAAMILQFAGQIIQEFPAANKNR